MDDEKLIISTNKILQIFFYICFSSLVLLSYFCFSSNYPFPKLGDAETINLQQLLILCLLGGIPGILVWSKNKMKTLAEISDIGERLKLYRKYAFLRQSVFFALGLFTLLIHVFTMMENALVLFGVLILLCMFIVPTKGRLEEEAQLIKLQPKTEMEPELESELMSEPQTDEESGQEQKPEQKP